MSGRARHREAARLRGRRVHGGQLPLRDPADAAGPETDSKDGLLSATLLAAEAAGLFVFVLVLVLVC